MDLTEGEFNRILLQEKGDIKIQDTTPPRFKYPVNGGIPTVNRPNRTDRQFEIVYPFAKLG